MKKLNGFILCCVIALCSCQDTKNNETSSGTDTIATMKMASDSNGITAAIDSTHTAQNSLDWKGTYAGVLPCADCEGIETEIMLHGDNTYMIETKYKGGKNKGTKGDGKFTWVDGNTIQLDNIKDGPSKYMVAENKLIQLDMNGKKIEGALADKYILIKK
jgi:uncharacterized lipoprotein NlpE involved in copper resistance